MFHGRVRRQSAYRFDTQGFSDFGPFTGRYHRYRPWRGPRAYRQRRSSTPPWALILLAGLAGLALMQLLSAANRPRRSTLEKVVLGALLVAAVAVVLRLRRSGRRYTW